MFLLFTGSKCLPGQQRVPLRDHLLLSVNIINNWNINCVYPPASATIASTYAGETSSDSGSSGATKSIQYALAYAGSTDSMDYTRSPGTGFGYRCAWLCYLARN
nr:hypothetical protein Q903MT_gene5012 [Picea sitchensis]